ncbi:hypothetical protein Hamer_G031372 [Homarus americanus]|uniref:Uncharacterized protein n=1 Tax=Homarus americanus TaxID=6706 RepID=A0A8J5JIT7_HOMAM|nr:hypothetical protein Hamer_G031372 [Homarus americanus]
MMKEMARYLNYLTWTLLLALCFSLTVAQRGVSGGGGSGIKAWDVQPRRVSYYGGKNASTPGPGVIFRPRPGGWRPPIVWG